MTLFSSSGLFYKIDTLTQKKMGLRIAIETCEGKQQV